MIIADVTNRVRLEGVGDNIKSPLAPLFEKGGESLHSDMAHCGLGLLILLQAFISSPFDKRLDMSSSNVGAKGIL